MLRRATHLCTFVLLVLVALPAQAQDPVQVTIRQINEVPQAGLDFLNTNSATLTTGDITANMFNDLVGQTVQFTAVILSDPRTSGLASINAEGFPDRVHVLVRDTTAASEGPEGHVTQLVAGFPTFNDTGLIDLGVGDVITVVAPVGPFGTSMQLSPESITFDGTYSDLGLPDSILDPVTITTADANMSVGGGQVQTNWDNLSDLNSQYVRIENATVLARDISSDRPNWLVTTDGGETLLSFYDFSLRYRNDRDGVYDEGQYNVRTDDDGDFVPPPPGSLINLQGFLIFQGDDPFARATPQGALLSIVPFEDSDLELLASPPVISGLTKPDAIPTDADAVTVSVSAQADPNRTLTETVLLVELSTGESLTISPSSGKTADEFSFEIPAQEDGTFVRYQVQSTDNTGAVSLGDPEEYRVLNAVDSIEDIQRTFDDAPGSPPNLGITADMDITATIQTQPSVSGITTVQDDAGLAPWSGIHIRDDAVAALNRGDVIRITNATIDRRNQFGFNNEAQLTDVTFETVSTGGEFLGYKAVTTDIVSDPSVAEAHEGMLLRFDNVEITLPDANFGQWRFATINADETLQEEVQADDESSDVSSSFNQSIAAGDRFEFFQGVWRYSFNVFQLNPETIEDGLATDTEEEAVPESFFLGQNYPNPFNPVTTIRYQINDVAKVKLEVFDLMGRRIATLVDTNQAIGTYEVNFEGSQLASGMYLYRLQAGTKVDIKKMMLVK